MSLKNYYSPRISFKSVIQVVALLLLIGGQSFAAVPTKSNEQCVRDYVAEQSIGKRTASRGGLAITYTLVSITRMQISIPRSRIACQ